MNKSQLTQRLAAQANLTRADAQRAIDVLFSPKSGVISGALREGQVVQINGFGRFEAKERSARTARNPRTGAEIEITPSTGAAFRPARILKEAISGFSASSLPVLGADKPGVDTHEGGGGMKDRSFPTPTL
jgi:DNA-binding protein HU-beta